jgi:succinyl-diaminopimelate desuccinylase
MRDKVNNLPTLLFYGHYDVQPVEQSKWETAPFDPVEKDGKIYARGTADDKLPILTFLDALIDAKKSGKELKYNIKILLEGEEEVGSGSLQSILKEHQSEGKFNADFAFVCDTTMKPEIPEITLGLRGITMWRLIVKNASQNLHSGVFGGMVLNPAVALNQILVSLVDQEYNLKVDGFYDDVKEFDPEVLKSIDDNGPGDSEIEQMTGAKALIKDQKYSKVQRSLIRPTFDVHSLHSGTPISTPSTIIPAEASAVFSTRLVADQDPERIYKLVSEHIYKYAKENLDESLEVKVELVGTYKPVLFDSSLEIFKEVKTCADKVWQGETIFNYCGGSIGIVNDFKEILGIDTVLFGLSYPDANEHGPDENFDLEQYEKGKAFFERYLF